MHLLSRRAVAFTVTYKRMMRSQQVDVMLVPLTEVLPLGANPRPLAGLPDTHWLVWQSANGQAIMSALPCDAAALAQSLNLTPQGAPVLAQSLKLVPQGSAESAASEALREVVEAAWRQGGIP